MGKLLDRIVQEPLADHLNETDKWHAMQSASRPNQSTETAMIWPSNLVLRNVSISISMTNPCMKYSGKYSEYHIDLVEHWQNFSAHSTVKVLNSNYLSEGVEQWNGVPQESIPRLYSSVCLNRPFGNFCRWCNFSTTSM